MFSSDRQRRKAWEARADSVMAAWSGLPGRRPWAWWKYEAGRSEHLTAYPDLLDPRSDDELAAALDEYEMEPIIWLARHGHLTDDEIAAIAEAADEARPRVGTDAEQIGSGGVDRADRRAVALGEAVRRALGQLPPPGVGSYRDGRPDGASANAELCPGGDRSDRRRGARIGSGY
jgi:hypothetical protein